MPGEIRIAKIDPERPLFAAASVPHAVFVRSFCVT